VITFVDITLFGNLGCKKALADKRRVAVKIRLIIFTSRLLSTMGSNKLSNLIKVPPGSSTQIAVMSWLREQGLENYEN
jgi:hypothetical protein